MKNFPWKVITTSYPYLDAFKKAHKTPRSLEKALRKAIKEDIKNEAKCRQLLAYLKQVRKQTNSKEIP